MEDAFQACDKDHDGTITHEEFQEWFNTLNKAQKQTLSKASHVTKKHSDALDAKLANRPTHHELKKKNVLHDDHDPTHSHKIQVAMKSLKKQFKSDSLHQQVRARPSKQELIKKNILPASHGIIDHSLVAPSKKLEQAFKSDVLSQAIRARPTPDDLHKAGIMHVDHHVNKMDRSLVAPSKALEKSFKNVRMNQLMSKRPSVAELKKKNILMEMHGTVADANQSKMINLESAMTKDKLHQSIRKRASLVELHEKGIVDMDHPHFEGHPETDGSAETKGGSAATKSGSAVAQPKGKGGDMNLKECLSEVQRALKNLRELRSWLEKVPA
jgi:hypothetical protein